jgi:hypothetical protein
MGGYYLMFIPIGYDRARPWPGVNYMMGLLKSRKGREAYNRVKRQYTNMASMMVLKDPDRPRLCIVEVTFTYVLKDRRMDPDNLGGMIRKFILDGITDGRKPGMGCGEGKGLFPDDSQRCVKKLTERWQVGKETGVHIRLMDWTLGNKVTGGGFCVRCGARVDDLHNQQYADGTCGICKDMYQGYTIPGCEC